MSNRVRMPDSDRPQDRIHRKKEKPPMRIVKMQLELDLADAIEVMAEVHQRTFHGMINACLAWAVWAHSHGRDPYFEMMSTPGGFTNWDENLDNVKMDPFSKEIAREWADEWEARLETHKLEKLYKLGEGETP
jgi:hypothetical protein